MYRMASILFCLLLIFVCDSVYSQKLNIKPERPVDLSAIYKSNTSSLTQISKSANDLFYLVDVGLNRVVMIDSSGIVKREIGGFGWQLEQFDQPMDIWAENALDVFVADFNNSRIQRFDRHLNFVTAIIGNELDDSDMQFAFPVALTFSQFGDLFIIESDLDRAIKFDEIGNPLLAFGDYDEGAGQLNQPVAICINKMNEIFISDAGQHCIFKYDYYGNFQQQISLPTLQQPGSIACNGEFVFVIDKAGSQIVIMSSRGEEIMHFTTNKTTANQESSLDDICIQKNRLYILDNSRKRIDCYNLASVSR